MSDYYQPSFYHFSEDSLELVHIATECYPDASTVLDVGAGCGVVGLEYCQKNRSTSLVLCELLSSFIPYLDKNITKFASEHLQVTVENCSFEKIINEKYHEVFDLILSNPPYFLSGSGRLSSTLERNICRFISHEQVELFSDTLAYSLAPKGQALFLSRDNYFCESLSGKGEIEKMKEVKGACLYRFQKTGYRVK